jgi:hypothetical protein
VLTKRDNLEFNALLNSITSTKTVSGSTHEYYRYPARFSPEFARSAIESLTEPGDTVLDPFMGGGTSAVEALACGRRFIGCDINPLSAFVARVKTTALTDQNLEEVTIWSEMLLNEPDVRARTEPDSHWEGYQINLPWWIRNTIEVALTRSASLHSEKARQFARCVVLKTGQWALDCRKHVPTARDFMERIRLNSKHMASGMREYRERISGQGIRPSEVSRNRRLFLGDAATAIEASRVPADWLPPRLILTSPPYLGVHILYHRWQVRGRRESPAPFWIAGSLDGFGAAHYTFGDRNRKDADIYLSRLKSCFQPIVDLMQSDSLLVQLVAFSKPKTQLDPFLETLHSIGLAELSDSQRMWRNVPNRKWYAELRGETSSSQEVLLVHRKI